MDTLPDPRIQALITYEARYLVWTAILMHIFRLPSRRRLRFDLSCPAAVDNLNALAQTDHDKLSHDGTVAYLFENMDPSGLQQLRVRMVRSVLRSRALERFRLLNRFYLVAIDGTGFLSFRRRHCPHCLEQKHPDGRHYYYHPVLEAKLVCENGLALSVDSEFIQNTDGPDPQDCELKAFYRLLPRLRTQLPRLPICLLLDALYLNQNVLSLIEQHRLHYIITFKEGSLPQAYSEFEALCALAPEQCLETQTADTVRRYRWMRQLEHKGHTFSAFECLQTDAHGESRRFLWATSLTVHRNNVETLSQKGGRCRWKIENEGFNRQKNWGFGLGHPFSKNWNAAKNFYLAMQLADLISQLLEKGSLIPGPVSWLFGSLAAFAARLLEAWRTHVIEPFALRRQLNKRFQIRLHHY